VSGQRRTGAKAGPTLVVANADALTVSGVVHQTAGILAAAGVPAGEALEQAREIVAALLDVGRHWPVAHPGDPADPLLLARAAAAARRLGRGMPFAYAVGWASFRGLTLEVDPRVLIPRPETELLVELVLDETRSAPGGTAIDVGTGSGAIALALAQEGAFDRVIGTDVSDDALAVARHNAAARAGICRTAVEFRPGSLLTPVRDVRARAIVSNPPYIAFDEAQALPASVRDWEPVPALLSGDQGLTHTRALVRAAGARLEAGGVFALEVDARRAALVAEMVSADSVFADVSVRLDLAGRERFVLARRREWP
jgi:release factor glutamine methyltransferase